MTMGIWRRVEANSDRFWLVGYVEVTASTQDAISTRSATTVGTVEVEPGDLLGLYWSGKDHVICHNVPKPGRYGPVLVR